MTTPKNMECSECWGQGAYWAEGNPDSAGDLYIPTPDIEFDGTVLVCCWKCNAPTEGKV